ncbi:hypothetical protein ANO14919_010600 [Xylariales sp. No.14919]|nr:hypothetical protein ANO14919_010600 [Xylariales sp. No.14919]
MIRVWLDRISESYCVDPHDLDGARFWEPHPGWFNVDAVRSNMIGMAATMVNRAMEGTTRIAIEPILDGAMQNTVSGRDLQTKTMLPVRRRLCPFVPDQNRRHPVCLQDKPNDNDNVNVVGENDSGNRASGVRGGGGDDSESSDISSGDDNNYGMGSSEEE